MNSNTNKILPEGTIPTSSSRSLKVGFLVIASSVAILAQWVLLKIALYGQKGLIFWIWPTILAALVISLLTLFSAVNYSRTLKVALGLMALAGYLVILPKTPFVILGGVIFFAMMFWFEQRIRAEERDRQDFSIRRVSNASIDIMVYAILLLLGLNIYYNTQAQFNSNPDRFYSQLGDSVSKSANFLLGEKTTGLDVNQPLDQYLQDQVNEENPDYNALPENQKQSLLISARDQFLKKFNISVSGAQPLSDVLSQIAVEKIKQAVGKYDFLFPLIFTLVILALLRTFAFVFRWVAIFLTWIIYKVLLSIRFFRIGHVQVEVEKLEI